MALTKEDLQAISELMDNKLEPIKADMSEVKSNISEVKQRVLKIELTQENDINPQIKLLAEGHGGVVDKLKGLDSLVEKVEDIQDTVDVLKHNVVKK